MEEELLALTAAETQTGSLVNPPTEDGWGCAQRLLVGGHEYHSEIGTSSHIGLKRIECRDRQPTMTRNEVFWLPTDEEIRTARVTAFRTQVNERYGLDLKDYWDLHRWSTGSPEQVNNFWTSLWDYSNIIGDKGPAPVSTRLLLSRICH